MTLQILNEACAVLADLDAACHWPDVGVERRQRVGTVIAGSFQTWGLDFFVELATWLCYVDLLRIIDQSIHMLSSFEIGKKELSSISELCVGSRELVARKPRVLLEVTMLA